MKFEFVLRHDVFTAELILLFFLVCVSRKSAADFKSTNIFITICSRVFTMIDGTRI